MRPWFAALFTVILFAASPAGADDNAPSQIPNHADYAERLNQLFGTLHSTNSTAEAQIAETKIRAIWSHDSSDEAVERLAKASLAMQVGDFETAESLLNKLILDHPEFSEAWNRRATMYFILGRMQESLADIDKVLALEPRHFGALSGKGAVLQSLGRNADAIAAMKEALAVDPFLPGLKDAIQRYEKTEPEL